jgi:hypothetical protein
MSAALLALIAILTPLAARAAPVTLPDGVPQSLEHVTYLRTTNIASGARAGAPPQAAPGLLETRQTPRGYRAIDVHPGALLSRALAATASVPFPTAVGRGVTSPEPAFAGFAGLTHFDQRTAGLGIYSNTQFSLEPPDQGLCVGNGFVMEPINNAMAIYAQGLGLLAGPVPMSQLFGLAPEIVQSTPPIHGPLLSDPRCYFDRDTQRWFVTEFEEDVNPATDVPSGRSALFIAISQTSSPIGNYNVLTIDTTDPGHPGCPCYPDQPLLGADANGIYLSTNEFPIFNPGFNGTQLYALSKLALALGNLPTVVHFAVGNLATPDVGGTWYSLQPALTPDTQRAHQVANGTEYLLSALDFFNKNDNRIAVWSVTNTASLVNPAPKVALHHAVVRSESYGQPPNATQRPGPRPLGTSLGAPLSLIDTNDDRMMQVVYAQGRLWAGLNTGVYVAGKLQAGAAVFVVDPTASGGLSPRITGQGYVAVAGENTMYPSIGVSTQGPAILACSLSGPNYFPSAVYVPLSTGNDKLRLAGAGAAPEDGFTGYPPDGSSARWGDYSAAVADEHGNIWFGAEYIPNLPRTPLANWGTFIGAVPIK